MTIRETYLRSAARLEGLYGPEEARAVVGRLLEEKYGVGPLARAIDGGTDFVRADEWEQDLRRLERWEPLQYVVGRAEFCGRAFEVTRDTLIPRGETEELVRTILDGPRAGRVLDIGTGSGAIAVTLAAEWPVARVEAWDISRGALEVAARNASRHGVEGRVRFVERDVLQFPTTSAASATEKFDLVVSNPPYVLDAERNRMRPNVLDYEPSKALFVPDDDPLRFYRCIARLPLLRSGGALWLEINERFGPQTAELLSELGYADIRILCDLHDKPRFVCGYWSLALATV